MELEPLRLQLVGPLHCGQPTSHGGCQPGQTTERTNLLHQAYVEKAVIGNRGRRQGEAAAGGRSAVHREDQHRTFEASVFGYHPHPLCAISEERRQGGHQIDDEAAHPFDLRRAVVDIAGEADTDGVEHEPVADPDQVNRTATAAYRRPRRLFELRRDTEGSRGIVTGAEGEDRELAASSAVEPLRHLAHRAVTARNHNTSDALGNRRGCEVGGVARRLGEDDGCGEAPLGEALGRCGPLAAKPAPRCRRIDDDSHGDSLTCISHRSPATAAYVRGE